ncbi:MAG: hypothetical protein AB1730_07055 [Myxococcota bacterium]
MFINLAFIAPLAALWFARSEPEAPGAVPALAVSATDVPSSGAPPRAPADAEAALVVAASRAAAPERAFVQPPADWRAKWASVPLDETGQSIKGKGRQTAFNQALHAAIRDDLLRRLQQYPPKVEQIVKVELFVEANTSGYDVLGAEVQPGAGLVEDAARCFELAWETRLERADAGTTAGDLFHVSYPILLRVRGEDRAP